MLPDFSFGQAVLSTWGALLWAALVAFIGQFQSAQGYVGAFALLVIYFIPKWTWVQDVEGKLPRKPVLVALSVWFAWVFMMTTHNRVVPLAPVVQPAPVVAENSDHAGLVEENRKIQAELNLLRPNKQQLEGRIKDLEGVNDDLRRQLREYLVSLSATPRVAPVPTATIEPPTPDPELGLALATIKKSATGYESLISISNRSKVSVQGSVSALAYQIFEGKENTAPLSSVPSEWSFDAERGLGVTHDLRLSEEQEKLIRDGRTIIGWRIQVEYPVKSGRMRYLLDCRIQPNLSEQLNIIVNRRETVK